MIGSIWVKKYLSPTRNEEHFFIGEKLYGIHNGADFLKSYDIVNGEKGFLLQYNRLKA